MELPPDLADKVLKAEVRNIVKNVGDGGTLTTAQREMMQAFAMSPESARQARALALIQKYCSGGDLSATQWAEIREVYPEFGSDPTPATAAAPPPGLTPDPPPTAGDGEITRAQLDRWSALYGVEHRQLRRWITRGREKGDPCPLDDPTAMPAWIEKHLEKIRTAMRDKVFAAAAAARQPAPTPTPAPAPVAEGATGAPPAPSPPTTPPTPSSTVAPLDLATVGGVEGESVGLFRRLFSAVKMQLEDAYKQGNEDQIRILHNRLEKVGESLRKHEIAAEARARRRGDLLERAEVLNDVTQLLTTLKLMHEQMTTRILGELPGLDPETQETLRRVILRERARELALLRTLSSFRSPDDVLFALAA